MPAMLKTSDALLLVIDIQSCFEKVVPDFERLAKASAMVIEAFKILKVPIIVSEQNSEKLGQTVEPIKEVLGKSYQPFNKMSFSLFKDPFIKKEIQSKGRNSLVLIGVETHVCLLQTALDALSAGYMVFVLDDCVSSRFSHLKELALRRLETSGAIISSAEIALFELLITAEHPNFKEIQSLVKNHSQFIKNCAN